MRIVFMGTPAFAADVLKRIAEDFDVVGVFTAPDAVRGRGRKLVASPVKEAAENLGLSVYTPKSLRDGDVADLIASLKPDAVCVAAYGAIVPPAVLDIPPLGCFNVHASLLPRWRGAAPVERALLSGDSEVGVCIMRMEEGLDTGDYCLSESLEAASKGAEELTAELAQIGAGLLVQALREAEAGTISWTSQDEGAVTYASKIAKGELNPDPDISASDNMRRVRASSAAHPARAVLAGRTGTVLKAAQADGFTQDVVSGTLLFDGSRLVLGCADGAFAVESFKPDGKQAMDAKAFAAGLQGMKGDGYTWTAVDG